MNHQPEMPFDSIEGTQEYIELMLEAIEESRAEVAEDIAAAERNGANRRKEGLLIISHKLDRLQFHITKSRRTLNDLRTLSRLLLQERTLTIEEQTMAAKAAE